MGGFLDKPMTDKYQEDGEGNGIRYGVASMQGWRVEMEDAHMAKINLGEALKDWSYFAVFDGHAGWTVSVHCSEHLLETIMATEEFQDDVKKAIHKGFLELDSKMRSLPEMTSGEDKSGTTAVCAFVSPRNIYVANCGDSRAVLCRDKAPIFTTQDHKPVLPSERDRIVKAGGSVMIQRVNGSLAGSRDNMSIVLILFPGAPTPTPEAVMAEKELDATIERHVKEFLEQGDKQFSEILHSLMSIHVEGLPPGGGWASKRTLVERIFQELCPEQAESISQSCDFSFNY
ncbi:unnamed protein product [Diabrotica balteata]|uniref:PPM-type phosphatase domain-containing protein n=1 Tax=Diabrotica balteata TaxID=107213 RepID=A0A9N9XG11_DIABA|nr:unnamed protein product [Diabrotica balteata]